MNRREPEERSVYRRNGEKADNPIHNWALELNANWFWPGSVHLWAAAGVRYERGREAWTTVSQTGAGLKWRRHAEICFPIPIEHSTGQPALTLHQELSCHLHTPPPSWQGIKSGITLVCDFIPRSRAYTHPCPLHSIDTGSLTSEWCHSQLTGPSDVNQSRQPLLPQLQTRLQAILL